MSDAASSAAHGAASAEQADPTSPPGEVASAQAGVRKVRRPRAIRPRIDIDDTIREANRVGDLLKKMGQAAKTLKKTQTKAKQRLVKKAARLSPQDLERIAVLKRCLDGTEPDNADDTASSSSKSSSSSTSPAKGVSEMHNILREMMKGWAGAEDVVAGLGAAYKQASKRSEAQGAAVASSEVSADEEPPPRSPGMKRLASLRRLPSAPRGDVTMGDQVAEDTQMADE